MSAETLDATGREVVADASDRPGSPAWYMTSMHQDAIAWREEQADVDADIEGLARDDHADELDRQMQAAGVPPEERIARLKAYFQKQGPELTAAE